MNRPLRKTIEYQPEDLYFKYQFTDRGGAKHWSVHAVGDMNTKKQPVAMAKKAHNMKNLQVEWAEE